MSRLARLGQSLLVAAATLLLAVGLPPAPAAAATNRLPDLGMDRPRDFSIRQTSDGRRQLRFTTRIVNIGVGPFEVQALRKNVTGRWVVRQRIYNDAGGYRQVSTPAKVIWGGDGHNHFHLDKLQRFSLHRLKHEGNQVGRGEKTGFCFFDNADFRTLPGKPPAPVYTQETGACGAGQPQTLQFHMGLSVGWGDDYHADLPDQYIDLTNLPDGLYRLRVEADPNGWFRETGENNNLTWVDLRITGITVEVVAHGPNV
jgi:hypothetical protein